MTERDGLHAIVEHYEDGWVAYILGVEGAVVGEGSTGEEAVADVTSALSTYIEVFGSDVVLDERPKDVTVVRIPLS